MTPFRRVYYLQKNADTGACSRRLPDEQVDLVVEVFRMLADANRIQMLWALTSRELSVGELAIRVGRPAPSVSQHLAKLRMARLVRTRREGTPIFYSLDNDHIGQLVTDAVFNAEHAGPGVPGHHRDAAELAILHPGSGPVSAANVANSLKPPSPARPEPAPSLFVVTVIGLSAVSVGIESIRRLLNPVPVEHVGWVAAAGLVGFIGNGANGIHARTDGFTSLAVLRGTGGVALRFPLADPIIGLLITVAILAVLRTAVRDVLRRLMDGVDPQLIATAEAALAAQPGVTEVRSVKRRWIGHRLYADAELDIDPATSLAEAHRIAHEAKHVLTQAVPKLATALIHAYPASIDVPRPLDPLLANPRRRAMYRFILCRCVIDYATHRPSQSPIALANSIAVA